MPKILVIENEINMLLFSSLIQILPHGTRWREISLTQDDVIESHSTISHM